MVKLNSVFKVPTNFFETEVSNVAAATIDDFNNSTYDPLTTTNNESKQDRLLNTDSMKSVIWTTTNYCVLIYL